MVRVEIHDVHANVLLITLDRPGARNAIDGATAQAIEAAIDRLEADPDLRVGVLAHTGPALSAGADLKVVAAGRVDDILTARGGFAGLCERQRVKPIVVAVDGAAVGGGLEMVLACDVVVASTAARFGVPEVRRGLMAASGGTFRLARAIPRHVAMDLALTGEDLPADRAYALGLVSRLTEPGRALETAVEVAAGIAANAPLAVQASREMVDVALDHDDATLRRLAGAAARRVQATEDAREGPRAFAEKRPPRWQGR
jgi:enoyl-CoA hydratase/carnithine racemase